MTIIEGRREEGGGGEGRKRDTSLFCPYNDLICFSQEV